MFKRLSDEEMFQLEIGTKVWVPQNNHKKKKNLVEAIVDNLTTEQEGVIWRRNQEFNEIHQIQVKRALQKQDMDALQKLPAPYLESRKTQRTHIGVKTLGGKYLKTKIIYVKVK